MPVIGLPNFSNKYIERWLSFIHKLSNVSLFNCHLFQIAALLEEATQEARDRALLLAAEDAAFVTLNKRRSYFTPMTTAQGPEKLAATNEAK